MLSSTLLSVPKILFSNSLLFLLPPWMIKGTIMVSTPTWMLIKLFSRAQTSLPNSRFYLTISDISTSTMQKQLGFFCQNWTLYHPSSHLISGLLPILHTFSFPQPIITGTEERVSILLYAFLHFLNLYLTWNLKTTTNQCWWGCREIGTHVHYQWEWKMENSMAIA